MPNRTAVTIDRDRAKRIIKAINRLQSLVEFSPFARTMAGIDNDTFAQMERDKQFLKEKL